MRERYGKRIGIHRRAKRRTKSIMCTPTFDRFHPSDLIAISERDGPTSLHPPILQLKLMPLASARRKEVQRLNQARKAHCCIYVAARHMNAEAVRNQHHANQQ